MAALRRVAAAAAALTALAAGTGRPAVTVRRQVRQHPVRDDPALPSSANCTWVSVQQPLSHFAPGATEGATFSQRVCVYDKYWSGGQSAGPIFFYVGNESPVDEYVNGTGLMWESGPEFGALLVWAEHRYFGESMPQLEGAKNCLAWLSSEEALADYAAVIEALRAGAGPFARWRAPRSRVVSFGGSYGGMLSAWFRMKYPGHVDGAIAASAPIWGFPSERPALDGSSAQLSNSAGPKGGAPETCAPRLKAAYVLLHDAARTAEGRQLISEAMGLCEPLQTAADGDTLLGYLQGPIFNLAEGSYPFPTDYITFATFNGTTAPLPAWPVRRLCEPLSRDFQFGVSLSGDVANVQFQVRTGAVRVDVDWDKTSGNGHSASDLRQSDAPALWAALAKGIQVWYNVTGTQKCVDWRQVPPSAAAAASSPAAALRSSEGRSAQASAPSEPVCGAARLDQGSAWGALCCNQGMNLVNTVARGFGRDLFWPPSAARNVTLEDVVPGSMAYCSSYAQMGLFGLPKEPDAWARWTDISYGGKRIESHTNIFFSNGDLDPWTAAGVPAPGLSAALPSVLIAQGGHHVDLFFSTPEDPESIREVRKTERAQIAAWLKAKDEAAPIEAFV